MALLKARDAPKNAEYPTDSMLKNGDNSVEKSLPPTFGSGVNLAHLTLPFFPGQPMPGKALPCGIHLQSTNISKLALFSRSVLRRRGLPLRTTATPWTTGSSRSQKPKLDFCSPRRSADRLKPLPSGWIITSFY